MSNKICTKRPLDVHKLLDYMQHKMLMASIGKKAKPKPLSKSVPFNTITRLDQTTFDVQDTFLYRVDLSIGVCSCPMGNTGAVCKHQAACADFTLQVIKKSAYNKPSRRIPEAQIPL